MLGPAQQDEQDLWLRIPSKNHGKIVLPWQQMHCNAKKVLMQVNQFT